MQSLWTGSETFSGIPGKAFDLHRFCLLFTLKFIMSVGYALENDKLH